MENYVNFEDLRQNREIQQRYLRVDQIWMEICKLSKIQISAPSRFYHCPEFGWFAFSYLDFVHSWYRYLRLGYSNLLRFLSCQGQNQIFPHITFLEWMRSNRMFLIKNPLKNLSNFYQFSFGFAWFKKLFVVVWFLKSFCQNLKKKNYQRFQNSQICQATLFWTMLQFKFKRTKVYKMHEWVSVI